MADEIKRDTVDYRDTSSFDDSSLQDVQTIKSAILHKQYGEDVRSALAQLPDSLIKLFGDTGGNSNAEVEEARGGFETLGLHEQAQNSSIDKVTVEVQNARTNSSSQTYSTLKERLDNQENDLNNSINEKLATMRLTPETFANEAALRAKYPQGNDQLNVTTDNGHLWIWIDGDFKDCGQFQTAGIDQALVDQIKEAFAFANGNNFIANGSFTTGKTDPAINTNNDTHLAVTDYLGRKWLQITGVGNSSMRGAQWAIDGPDKVAAIQRYPLQLSFHIQSSIAQTFGLDVHLYDKDGNGLDVIGIDEIALNASEIFNYQKTVDLNIPNLAGVTKVVIMIYSNVTGDMGTTILTGLSAKAKYNDGEKWSQLKGNELIDGQPIINNTDTVISTAEYLDQEWLKMTSTANTQFRGIQWQITDPDKILAMATYPVKFHFNIQSSITQTFGLDIHFYDKDGKGLEPIYLHPIALNASVILNYQNELSLDSNRIKDVAKVVLMLYTSGTNDLGTVLINDYSAVLEYNTNKKPSYEYKNIPEVYLDGATAGMSGTNYVKMQFKFKDNGREVDGFASTKFQGDSSLAWSKKAYRIKTFEDESLTKSMKFKPSPLWSAGNKYNLKAYYTDAVLCRDVVNANIGTDLWATQKNMPDDLANTQDFGFIDGFPIKVFINNEFAGIYSFNTAKGDYGKNAKAVISGETYSDPTAFSALPTGGVKLDGSDFEMVSPDNPTDEIKQAVNSLITFVSTSSDGDFKAQLGTHIDLESLIDYFIFNTVIENTDAAGKNQTLITWDLQKWYFHPYDLDTTYGVDANGNLTNPPDDLFGFSHLFTRLKSLFTNEIKSRYKELRTWLTPAYVLKMYRDHINLIGESNYEDEFKLWNNPNHDKNTYNFIKIHVYKRFKLLDSLWLQ